MKNPGKVRRLRRRTPRTARGKIRAIRYEDGWIMTFIGPKGDKGEVEYPAEGYIFKSRAETYTHPRRVYASDVWSWRESDKTILLDYPDYPFPLEEEEEIEESETVKEARFWSKVKRNWN